MDLVSGTPLQSERPSGRHLLDFVAGTPIPFALVAPDRTLIACTRRFVAGLVGREDPEGPLIQQLLYDSVDVVNLIGTYLGHDIGDSFAEASDGLPVRVDVAERVTRSGLLPATRVNLRGVHDERTKPIGVSITLENHEPNDQLTLEDLATPDPQPDLRRDLESFIDLEAIAELDARIGHASATDSARALRASSPYAEWMHDHNRIESAVSDRFCTIMCCTRDVLAGRTVAEFWGENMHPEDVRRLTNTASSQTTPISEYRMKHADGEYRWMRSEGWPVKLNPDRSIAVASG